MYGEETPSNPEAFMAFKLTSSGDIIPFPGDMPQSRAAVGEPSQFKALQVCGVEVKGPVDPLAYSVAMFGPIERWTNSYQYPPNIHGFACGYYHDCVIPPHMIPGGAATTAFRWYDFFTRVLNPSKKSNKKLIRQFETSPELFGKETFKTSPERFGKEKFRTSPELFIDE